MARGVSGNDGLGRARVALLTLVLAIGLVCLGLAPASAQQKPVGFQTISTDQLAQMLRDKDFALINVHIPYEGEIARTDAFIPFDQIGANLDRLPADRETKIVLYCKSGRMSEIAANELASRGYTNVSHVAGGFVAWAKKGHELLKR